MNGLDPSLMTAEERFTEAARILLKGILRSQQKSEEKPTYKHNYAQSSVIFHAEPK